MNIARASFAVVLFTWVMASLLAAGCDPPASEGAEDAEVSGDSGGDAGDEGGPDGLDATGDGPEEEDVAGEDAAGEVGQDAAGDAADAEQDAADAEQDAADAAEDAAAETAPCEGSWAPPVDVGTLPGLALVEVSGLAASRRAPGVLWAHNDSGADAVVYALTTEGEPLGELALPGINAEDFEDLAAAPCPDGERPCLWVADIGNNLLNRDVLTVYAVVEPTPHGGGPWTPEALWVFPFRYPADTVDAEAFFVAPEGGAFFVVEKVDGATARLFGTFGPLTPNATDELVELVAFPSPGVAISKGRMITGADLHPAGTHVVLRTYSGSFEYRLPSPLDWPALATSSPVTVSYGPLTEAQGEAIAYMPAEGAIYTASEDPQGKGNQPLHRYDCLGPVR